MHHIKSTLPDIKARIESQKKQFQAEMIALGGGPGEDNAVIPQDRLGDLAS